jgi:hypothetical protein
MAEIEANDTQPNLKLSKAEQKQITLDRKIKKFPQAGMIQQCKKLWEIIRQKKIEPAKRKSALIKMKELITGNIKEVSRSIYPLFFHQILICYRLL